MTISIIIVVKTWQNNLEECLNKCLELDYPDFEILILPDNEGTLPAKAQGLSPPKLLTSLSKGTVPLRIIPTGPVSPAQKRDMAIDYAKGEIFAFIDDDAYPEKNWLKNAIKNFIDPEVAAVGGPAITPKEDTLKQKASGMTYSSILVSGKYIYRYLPKRKRKVDDYPTCNFLVRKSIIQELGGFKTNFWPGEDTKLCLDITEKLGKKIIYDPEVKVYHHRRPLFMPHLKQVASYALHRGYFVKRYPKTSFKFYYFVPTLWVFGLVIGGLLSVFSIPLRIICLSGLFLYLFMASLAGISKGFLLLLLLFLSTILTHITYGIYFLKGLLSRRLKEE